MASSSTQALPPLKDERTVLLTTYRRDGAPVATAVNLAVEDGHAYFRTYDRAWKAKRLRNNRHVLVAPSTMSGKPTGTAIKAASRLVEGEDARHAAELIDRKHRLLQGVFVHLYHRVRGYKTLHYELVPE